MTTMTIPVFKQEDNSPEGTVWIRDTNGFRWHLDQTLLGTPNAPIAANCPYYRDLGTLHDGVITIEGVYDINCYLRTLAQRG